MRWVAAFIAWMVTAPVLHAADWIVIRSTNFELLTNAGETEGRKTLTTFEEARDFFVREKPSFVVSPSRARIVGFNSFRDYRPYSLNSGALAYFLRQEPEDYIVISDLEMERMRVAIHEYVHLLVSHSGLSIPLWLNEGMADVYATLKEENGKLVLGAIQHDRVLALGSRNWMRLPTLLRVDAKPGENHQANLEMFYAQSCLLAHMLMLGDGYADKFPKFLDRISATGSTQAAFSEIYGKTTAEIDREMNTYFRQSVQGGAVFRTASVKVEIDPSRPATGAEVGVTLANLAARVGRTADARDRLKQLVAEFPRNAEIAAARGYVEELSGEKGAALGYYREALSLDPSGWGIHWNYARILDDAGEELEPRVQALERALEKNPDLIDARLRLGRNLCGVGRFADALALLQQAEKVEPERVAARFLVMTLAALGSNQADSARQYAEEAGRAARTQEEKAAVERLLAQIEQNRSQSSPVVNQAPLETDSERPILRRGRPVTKKP